MAIIFVCCPGRVFRVSRGSHVRDLGTQGGFYELLVSG